MSLQYGELRPTTDWDRLGSLGGSCPVTEFCQVQNALFVQVLRSPIFAALLHGTRAVGVSQTLRRGTRMGITELSLLVCTTYIWQGGHHVGHRPTLVFHYIAAVRHSGKPYIGIFHGAYFYRIWSYDAFPFPGRDEETYTNWRRDCKAS